MNLGLIILAGGQSKRMGRDKAFLPIYKHTFIEELLARSEQAGFCERLIVTNRPDRYEGLSVAVTSDVYPQLGPMSGLHAGLLMNKAHYNLLVPCDTPLLDFSLADMLGIYLDGRYDAVIPEINGRYQPLAAIYSKNCLPVIERLLLHEQEKRLIKLSENVKSKFVSLNLPENCFYNVNTLEDFAKIRHKLQ